MEFAVNRAKLVLVEGDITKVPADAIVNRRQLAAGRRWRGRRGYSPRRWAFDYGGTRRD